MEITYYGAGCVYISTKKTSILVDPEVESYGLKLPKLKADLVLYTLLDEERSIPKDALVIDWPGEYEISNVFIHGIPARLHIDEPGKPRRAIMYTIAFEGKKVLITGNIAPELSDKQFEQIGSVQALVLPVGGNGLTLDGVAAAELANRLEPQAVVPVHYDDGKTKFPAPQAKLDVFLSEIGSENPEPQDKLKLSAKDETTEQTKVVVLNRPNKNT